MSLTTVDGSLISSEAITLTTQVTGTLPVANGGTGVTTVGTSGNVLTSNGTTWASVATLQVEVRQTVLQSPVDTSGYPSFLASTFAGLVASTQNVSTGVNSLVVTAAQGSGLSGDINVVGQSTANLTWAAATASNTNYLPISISGGVLTAATPVILAPIYQWGGTPSVTSGQYTFNIQQMIMYLGNGSTAPAVNHVIVGEVVAGASTITSTVAYALMGRHQSQTAAGVVPVPTRVSASHNIGVKPNIVRCTMICITAEIGYVAGNEMEIQCLTAAANTNVVTFGADDRLLMGVSASATGTYIWQKSGGAIIAFTAARWAMRFYAERGW